MSAKKDKLDIGFSINDYDRDGDAWDEGIFIHINSSLRLKVGSMANLDDLIKQLENSKAEIKENYPDMK